MGFTGKQANKLKLEFIRAFNEMEAWIKERLIASVEYKVMSSILEQTRLLKNKETKVCHYSNEAKLINWAVTGEFKALDRECLSLNEIALLNELQARNAVLIGAGMTRDNRKESLLIMAELKRHNMQEVA